MRTRHPATAVLCTQAIKFGQRMSHNWLALNATACIRWSLIWTALPGSICDGAGLLRADEPWGRFQGQSADYPAPNLHMVAHWSWFTEVGWTLLLEGRGSGYNYYYAVQCIHPMWLALDSLNRVRV